MTPALCLTSGSTPSSTALKKRPIRPGVEVLLEAEIEQHVERVAPGAARDLGDRAVGEAGVLGLDRRGDDDPLPVALEHGPGLRIAQIGAEGARESSGRGTPL